MTKGSREWLDTPPPRAMSVAEWQQRMTDTFHEGGVIGPRLVPVFEAERAYSSIVDLKSAGHMQLRENFQSFLYETLRLGESFRSARGASAPQRHGAMLLEFASLFRVFRAADVLFHSGYPLDGVALLRDARDRAMFLAAVGRSETTLVELEGFEPKDSNRQSLHSDERTASRRRRANTERTIIRRTIGGESGFPEEVIDELKGWTQLFHMEVHGSRLTRASEFREYYIGKAQLPLEPAWRELPMAMFLNRFTEAAWLVHRCLPQMQLVTKGFGETWASRWRVLDDSMREDVASTWRTGKPIFGAITFLVEAKFDFSPSDFFTDKSEGDPSGLAASQSV